MPRDVLNEAKSKALIPLAKVDGSFGCVESELCGPTVTGLLLDKLEHPKSDAATLEVRANCKLAESKDTRL